MPPVSNQSNITYFKREEFSCFCCNKNKVSDKLLSLLETCRSVYGKSMFIESGYRCEKHNAEVGGAPESAHVKGEAADIRCLSSSDRYALLRVLLTFGAKRIGLHEKFIHVDVSETLAQNVMWIY